MLKSAARDRRRVDFFLFYLIGAVDANVLRFFEAIFAKKVRFFSPKRRKSRKFAACRVAKTGKRRGNLPTASVLHRLTFAVSRT